MQNKVVPQSEVVSRRLEELMNACHLLVVCGVDAKSGCVVDIIPILEKAIDYAIHYSWSPSSQWRTWQDQLTLVSKYITEHSDLIRPLVASGEDSNPLWGEYEEYPLLALFLQPNLVGTSALSDFIISAAIYRLARNLNINIERHTCDRLRKSISKEPSVLERLLEALQKQGLTTPYSHWDVAKQLRHEINSSKDTEDLSFFRWILTLVNIETDEAVLPVMQDFALVNADPDQDDNSSAEVSESMLRSVITGKQVEESNTLIVESDYERQIKAGASAYDLELEDNASGQRSSYWLDSIEKSVPYVWSALNPIERDYLVKDLCILSKDPDVITTKLLLLLSMLTSLKIEDVCALPIGKGKALEMPGTYRRCVVHPVNAYMPPEEASEYLSGFTQEFSLNLPTNIQLLCKLSFKDDGLTVGDRLGGNLEGLKDNCHKYLSLLRKSSGYRYFTTRIQSMFRHALNRKGVNKLAIYFLTAAPSDSPPIEAYYVALTENQLQKYFDDVVSELLGD